MSGARRTSGERNGGSVPTRPLQILLVEHDAAALSRDAELLRAAGYIVTAAPTFEDGRRAVQSAPDLLMTEVRLGAYNGLQLIMRARAHNLHIPAIVLTRIPDAGLRHAAERMGAIYLEKPVAPQRLLAVVADALARTPQHDVSQKNEQLEPAASPSVMRYETQERRRWIRAEDDANAPGVSGRIARSAERSEADERPVSARQPVVQDGDVIVLREPAGVDRPPGSKGFPSIPQFRVSVRGERDDRARLFATYERAVMEGEAVASQRRVRLFYVEEGVLTLLKQYRPARGNNSRDPEGRSAE